MKGFIVGIVRPRETVGIIDLEVVPTGICGVTVNTKQERQTQGGTFGVTDNLHHWDIGIIDLTFILHTEDGFEG